MVSYKIARLSCAPVPLAGQDANIAQMAELVDALGSGPSGGNTVEVRVLFWAPFIIFRRSARPAYPAVKPARVCRQPEHSSGSSLKYRKYSSGTSAARLGSACNIKKAFHTVCKICTDGHKRRSQTCNSRRSHASPSVTIFQARPLRKGIRITESAAGQSVGVRQGIASCKILQLFIRLNPLSYNALLHVNQYWMAEHHSHARRK